VIELRIGGKAMEVIKGSDLYQNPIAYSRANYIAALKTGRALHLVRRRQSGRSFAYLVKCDTDVAEVLRDYCQSVGETFTREAGPDQEKTREDGRALLIAAARIEQAIKEG
jgi:hypothetical protein